MRQNGGIIADDRVIIYMNQFWKKQIGRRLPGKTDVGADLHTDQAIEPTFESKTGRVARQHNHQPISQDLKRRHRFIQSTDYCDYPALE